MRRLVYVNREDEYIQIFNLTEEEEEKYEEFVKGDDYYGDDFDVVEGMLKARGIDYEFPVYFVTEFPVMVYGDSDNDLITDL